MEQLEQLETKLAYLERANADLSDVLFRQHRDIEALRAQVAVLTARLDAAEAGAEVRGAEDERPPHY